MSTPLHAALDPSGFTLAALVAGAAIVALLIERALLGSRFVIYHQVGFPLGEELIPLIAPPEGEGRTASVRYRVEPERGVVLFWSQPGDRSAPMGLHGAVSFAPTRRGVALSVRWAPLWTPFLALFWFAGLGIARGQGALSVAVASVLMVVIGLSYRRAATRAARELRWAFVNDRSDDDGTVP